MCLMCFKHCDYVKLFQSETLIEQGHLNQDFHFGPGTVKVYTRAAPNTTSFRAEPCT